MSMKSKDKNFLEKKLKKKKNTNLILKQQSKKNYSFSHPSPHLHVSVEHLLEFPGSHLGHLVDGLGELPPNVVVRRYFAAQHIVHIT